MDVSVFIKYDATPFLRIFGFTITFPMEQSSPRSAFIKFPYPANTPSINTTVGYERFFASLIRTSGFSG